MAWEENDQIKGVLSGVVVRYPKSKVERIERDQDEKMAAPNKGFKFDVWYSGMDVDEVMRVAEKNGKTLQRDELNSGEKSVEPLMSAKSAGTHLKFSYQEQLLDKSAAVQLILTPNFKKLYRLSIRWSAGESSVRSEFFNKVMTNMVNSYGKPVKQAPGLLSNTYFWTINKNAIVAMEVGVEFVEIKYLDKAIEKSAKTFRQP